MPEDAAHETVVHLRGAALELIAAARAVLDLTEAMVNDPAPLVALVTSMAAAAKDAAASAQGPTTGAEGAAADGRPPSPRVQHVRVS